MCALYCGAYQTSETWCCSFKNHVEDGRVRNRYGDRTCVVCTRGLVNRNHVQRRSSHCCKQGIREVSLLDAIHVRLPHRPVRVLHGFSFLIVATSLISRRIYDFLDRFGLINTRTGGKRPPSVQLPPPAMHVWSPTPPRRGGEPLFSREHRHGKRGAVAPERETGTGGGSSASGSMSSASAGSGSFAVDRRESPVQGWGLDAGEPGQQQKRPGHTRSDDREWHRQELVRLMEAAVARPNQWDVVAQQVRRCKGRPPGKRF